MRFDAFDVGSRRINGVRNFQAGAGIAALRVIPPVRRGSTERFDVRRSGFVVLVRRSGSSFVVLEQNVNGQTL